MGWVKNAAPDVEAASQWPMIIPVIVVLTALSIIVVSWRLWIRFKARGLALDDHFSALSMLFAIIYSALSIARRYHSEHPGFLGILTTVQKQDMASAFPLRFVRRPTWSPLRGSTMPAVPSINWASASSKLRS